VTYQLLAGHGLSGIAPIGMLEYWKYGIMGFGVMVWWFNGKIHLDRNINKWITSAQASTFHHSGIPLFHFRNKFGNP